MYRQFKDGTLAKRRESSVRQWHERPLSQQTNWVIIRHLELVILYVGRVPAKPMLIYRM